MKDVLRILERDARTPRRAIATMTGKSVEEVDRLIAEAEQSKTILKYKAVVNWQKTGDQEVMALIEVKVTPERDVGFDAVAERIYGFPEARAVYLLSGTYDLAVLVTAKDIYDVSRFVSNKLASISGVTGTVTHFVLKRYKEDHEVLVDGEGTSRQSVTP